MANDKPKTDDKKEGGAQDDSKQTVQDAQQQVKQEGENDAALAELASLKERVARAEQEVKDKSAQLAKWKAEHAVQESHTLVREEDAPDGTRVIRSKTVRPEHQAQARVAQWPSAKGEDPKPKKVVLNDYLCTDPTNRISPARVTDCCDESEARRAVCAEAGVKPKDVKLHIRRLGKSKAA